MVKNHHLGGNFRTYLNKELRDPGFRREYAPGDNMLGYLDSNQGMRESKSRGLPLADTPKEQN